MSFELLRIDFRNFETGVSGGGKDNIKESS
jgi:hypothetical protein